MFQSLRCLFLIVMLALASVAHAETVPPTAKSLPAINVMCFRSFDVAAPLERGSAGVAIEGQIEGGYRDTPLLQLMAAGERLKVIKFPSMPAYRTEYGISLFEINVGMIVDPAKRPPIFAWRMHDNASTEEVYAFRLDDGILSIIGTFHDSNKGLITLVDVLKCK
jgi:hypothetical protein